MFVDDVTIKLKAGHGGKGVVAFNKTRMSLGPTGGNGGKGGDVYLEGVSNISALAQFRYKKEVLAKSGGDGKNNCSDGEKGKTLILSVPVGTVVHNLSTKKDLEIISIGEKVLIAKGGFGGHGNFFFRSSINTSPKKASIGTAGEELSLRLEIKLIADVGFIGLPNVGKTSLLNELTNAQSKVANYSFTTLTPNLGTYYELILADIPGLIDGASSGKGLGIKFLRHIERTKTLFHFISAESSDPAEDYKTIRNELDAHNKELLEKQEYVFLTKTDLFDKKDIAKKIDQLKKIDKKITPISIVDEDSIKKVEVILRKLIKLKYEQTEEEKE